MPIYSGRKKGDKMKKKSILKITIYDIIGSIFLAISVDVFAVNANFAPGGITGLGVILNYLFNIPIGLSIIFINIPIVIFTFKKLGKEFFFISIKSIIISSFFIDYLVYLVPTFTGNRLVAAILSGIFSGIGYAIFFNEGSSTGGTDFVIVAIKKWKPKLSFGFLAFVIDGIVIILSVFIFKEIEAFICGMIYTVVTSIVLDLTTKFLERY